MKKLLLATATAAAFATSLAHAQTPAPTPEHTVTGNMTIATDYRFRGISQTFGEGFFTPGPAIQGGIDYSHSSGLYLGRVGAVFNPVRLDAILTFQIGSLSLSCHAVS